VEAGLCWCVSFCRFTRLSTVVVEAQGHGAATGTRLSRPLVMVRCVAGLTRGGCGISYVYNLPLLQL